MFENFGRTGYIIIISLILGTAFLSQQPYAIEYGSKFYLGALSQEKVYQVKLTDWVTSIFFKKANGEVTGGGEAKTNTTATNKDQNKIFQNIFQK